MEFGYIELCIALRKNAINCEHLIITNIPYPITPCMVVNIIRALKVSSVKSITLKHPSSRGFEPNFRLDALFLLFSKIEDEFPKIVGKRNIVKYDKTFIIESEMALLPGVDVAVSVPVQSPTLSTIFKKLNIANRRVCIKGSFLLCAYTRSSFA